MALNLGGIVSQLGNMAQSSEARQAANQQQKIELMKAGFQPPEEPISLGEDKGLLDKIGGMFRTPKLLDPDTYEVAPWHREEGARTRAEAEHTFQKGESALARIHEEDMQKLRDKLPAEMLRWEKQQGYMAHNLRIREINNAEFNQRMQDAFQRRGLNIEEAKMYHDMATGNYWMEVGENTIYVVNQETGEVTQKTKPDAEENSLKHHMAQLYDAYQLIPVADRDKEEGEKLLADLIKVVAELRTLHDKKFPKTSVMDRDLGDGDATGATGATGATDAFQRTPQEWTSDLDRWRYTEGPSVGKVGSNIWDTLKGYMEQRTGRGGAGPRPDASQMVDKVLGSKSGNPSGQSRQLSPGAIPGIVNQNSKDRGLLDLIQRTYGREGLRRPVSLLDNWEVPPLSEQSFQGDSWDEGLTRAQRQQVIKENIKRRGSGMGALLAVREELFPRQSRP